MSVPNAGGGETKSPAGTCEPEEPRHMRADAKRNNELIIEAARKVFAGQGGSASIEAIAKEAGVGIGTFYRHFPKRINLVEAVYRDDVDSLSQLASESAEQLDPWDALERWLWGFADYARSKRTFLNELHEAFENNPDLRSNSREKISVSCSQVLARAQEAGMARSDINGDDLVQLIAPVCTNTTIGGEQNTRLIRMILDGLKTLPSPS